MNHHSVSAVAVTSDRDLTNSVLLVSMANFAVPSYLSVIPLQQFLCLNVSSHFSPSTMGEPFYDDCYDRNNVRSNNSSCSRGCSNSNGELRTRCSE